jgi:hypothetical protein
MYFLSAVVKKRQPFTFPFAINFPPFPPKLVKTQCQCRYYFNRLNSVIPSLDLLSLFSTSTGMSFFFLIILNVLVAAHDRGTSHDHHMLDAAPVAGALGLIPVLPVKIVRLTMLTRLQSMAESAASAVVVVAHLSRAVHLDYRFAAARMLVGGPPRPL